MANFKRVGRLGRRGNSLLQRGICLEAVMPAEADIQKDASALNYPNPGGAPGKAGHAKASKPTKCGTAIKLVMPIDV